MDGQWFDDTVYFLPCWSEEEARFVEMLLASEAAHEFFHSMIHWDEKRPITVDILKRLSIRRLAAAQGRERDYLHFIASKELPLISAAEATESSRNGITAA